MSRGKTESRSLKSGGSASRYRPVGEQFDIPRTDGFAVIRFVGCDHGAGTARGDRVVRRVIEGHFELFHKAESLPVNGSGRLLFESISGEEFHELICHIRLFQAE